MADKRTQFDFGANQDKGVRLAMILQAIEDANLDFAEVRADFKARIDRLQKELFQVRQEILSGQTSLLDIAVEPASAAPEHVQP